MSKLALIFWGICILFIGFGFFLEKVFGSKAPEKSDRQIENEELSRERHSHHIQKW